MVLRCFFQLGRAFTEQISSSVTDRCNLIRDEVLRSWFTAEVMSQ
jgi:hypothetical protein